MLALFLSFFSLEDGSACCHFYMARGKHFVDLVYSVFRALFHM